MEQQTEQNIEQSPDEARAAIDAALHTLGRSVFKDRLTLVRVCSWLALPQVANVERLEEEIRRHYPPAEALPAERDEPAEPDWATLTVKRLGGVDAVRQALGFRQNRTVQRYIAARKLHHAALRCDFDKMGERICEPARVDYSVLDGFNHR